MQVNCAQCGAKFPVVLDSPFAACPFCASTLFLDEAATFRHLGLPARIGATAAESLLEAEAVARDWPLPKPLHGEMVLLPFWGVRGESLQETLPAFSPCPSALAGFRLPAAQADWFRIESYPGFREVSPSEMAHLAWQDRADVTSFALYSAPFCRFRFGDPARPYEAYVDVTSGSVIPITAPPGGGRDLSKTFLRVISVLIGAFALEALLLPGTLLPLLAMAVTGGALYPWIRRHLRAEVHR